MTFNLEKSPANAMLESILEGMNIYYQESATSAGTHVTKSSKPHFRSEFEERMFTELMGCVAEFYDNLVDRSSEIKK